MRTFALGMGLVLLGCGSSGTELEESEEDIGTAASALTVKTIYVESEKVYALEVSQCAEPSTTLVGLAKSWTLPSWVTQATIFSNGFSTGYENGEHNVRKLANWISDVKYSNSKLSWMFRARLFGNGNPDGSSNTGPSKHCWYATIVGWNASSVLGSVKPAHETNDLSTEIGEEIYRSTVPGTCLSSNSMGSVNLPQGIDFTYEPNTEHNLRQVAFSQTQDVAPGTCAAYDVAALVKDDSKRKNKWSMFTTEVTGLDVRSYAPEFTFTPVKATGAQGCITGGGAPNVEHREEVVSSPYFLPILSGFNIRTMCSDRPIKELGVSIRNIKYTASTNKLTYDVYSEFADSDNKPGHYLNYNVGKLGMWR